MVFNNLHFNFPLVKSYLDCVKLMVFNSSLEFNNSFFHLLWNSNEVHLNPNTNDNFYQESILDFWFI